MKYFLILGIVLITCTSPFAQSCQKVNVLNTRQKDELMSSYIKSCNKGRYFFEDKGAVKLVIYQDSHGLTNWKLSALVDDRYRSFPPEQYAYFGNYVIIVYKGDSTGSALPIVGDAKSRDLCIQEVLGSRVYEVSTKKQYVYVEDHDGKEKRVPVQHLSGGNTNNDLVIRFNADGTITKFIPV